MPYSRKSTFASSACVLLFFALFLFPIETRADDIVIDSGFLTIGGTPFSRSAWRSIGFNFSGNNFSASGGAADGQNTQGINSPCSSVPCAPGTTVFPNSQTTLDGFGRATFNGTTVNAWWLGLDSHLTFNGVGVVIPDSTIPTITLTSSFTMTGSVFVHSLDSPDLSVVFSTTVSGSGTATLTLRYFTNFGPPGYVLSSIRYDFAPIPEPATLLLLGTGLAGMAARYRRRRRTNSDK